MNELTEYDTTTYTKCLDDMIKLMTERGIKVAILILVKGKAPFRALAFQVQTVQVEPSKGGAAISEDQKVGSQWPLEKEGGPCPLLDPTVLDDMLEEYPL